ncbi:MAG: carboxypeptidase-like regulatory domain-containing protein [Fuerstiella sp.]
MDEHGQPLEGVRVRPSVSFKNPPGDKKSLGTGTRLTTDEHGAWKFDMVPVSKSKVTVSFDHPDFQALRKPLTRESFELQPAEQPAVRIELSAGLSISGTVTDAAGKPVAGAVVKTKFINERREAVTDAAGKYRIRGCEPMMTRIVIAAKGYATDMQEHRVDADMKPVDFKLKAGGHVRIRVVDENGKGLRRARIFFQDWRGNSEYFEFDHIGQYTDDDGVWEWHDAPLDEFTADICRPAGMQLLSQPLIAREKEYVFSPPRMLVVSGKVVDAGTKKPVAKFRVVPGTRNEPYRGTDDWWSRDEGYEATAGQYKLIRGSAAPTHMIQIEAEGYKVARFRDILSTEGAIDLDSELQPAKSFSIRLLTPEGKPAVNARVALGIKGAHIFIEHGLISDRSTYAKEMVTDAAGVFVMPARDDAFQIVATHPDGFTRLKSSDGPLPKTVTLTRYARVEGVFHIGASVGSEVRLSVASSAINSHEPNGPSILTQNHVYADKEGRFVFERSHTGGRVDWPRNACHGRPGARERDEQQTRSDEVSRRQHQDDHAWWRWPPGDYSGKVLWNFASVSVRVDLPEPEWPVPPADIQDDTAATSKWWEAWQQTDEGRLCMEVARKLQEEQRQHPRFQVSVDREGRFFVDDVTPGNYVVTAYFYRDAQGSLPDHRFVIPQLQDGDVGRELELGDLQMESVAASGG